MADYSGFRRRRSSQFRIGFIHLPFSNVRFWSKVTKYFFFLLLALVIATPLLFLWYSRDLPAPGTLVNAKYSDATHIYDRNGILLYSVYQDENRTYVKLGEISKYLQEGTISIEDKDFYKNIGFSPIAYLRVVKNFVTGNGLGGGSTISQQLAKIVGLNDSSRTLSRKIKELILAIQINQIYSKDQILEMYLNNIPYGGSSVGIEAAAETYFGVHASDLDIGEAAFLAGLPQSPTTYSPFSGNKYYLDRTQAVLTQMLNDGYITQKQATDGMAEIKNYTFSQKEGGIKAPHFVMYVKKLLADQFGEQAVETGGLQVTTTLDYNIEQQAEKIVNTEVAGLKDYHVTNGAAMVTDPKTGEILAMVGSEDYFDTANDGNFNVAISDNRQPGSSLKPIMYAVAFEHGYTPATTVMDVSTNFQATDKDTPYTPVNYDGKFHGPIQLRFALANSMNIPAVKMLARVGIQPVMQQAYNMGITNWQPTQANISDVGLSLVLGGRSTSLYDEMTAYGSFATEGVRHDLVSIKKVTDNNGNVLFQEQPSQGTRVLPADVSFLISHILLDNNARSMEFGLNSWLVVPGKTVSVKTGTTDDKRDNWTFGYTPSYVVGVWVGNNDNSPMNQAISSGETGASPIWEKIMSFVLKGKPDESPAKPDDVTAMQIDAFAGGLPHGGEPTRSEYFINGTQPTSESPIYQSENGQEYYVWKEADPVSTDGKNRWQDGINAWIQQNHSGDKPWNPPSDLLNPPNSTPTPTP
ncbi:MAG TPA: transglycosylase domain-containing protein [Patescibacteria group bacterium]|nr:transglycosylase domain-containing protein [Patescibacteria group bacterium]